MSREPGLAARQFQSFIRAEIRHGDRESLHAFFRYLRDHDPQLLRTVLQGSRLLILLDEGHFSPVGSSLGRVLWHAVQGEFYQGHGTVSSEWDYLAPYGLATAASERDAEDTASMVIDLILSVVPGLDQVADVRDISAYVSRMLNVDGRHQSGLSGGEWFGFVLTLIGAIPELGSVLKGFGRAFLRVGGSGLDAVRRVLGELTPRAMRRLRRVARRARLRWATIVRDVRALWDDIAREGARALADLGTLAGEGWRRRRALWRLARMRARRAIPEALDRAFRMFMSALEVLGGLPARFRATLDTAADVARRARDFARRFDATGRLRLLDDELTRLDDAQRAVRAGLEGGAGSRVLRRLISDLSRIADDVERRLGSLSGAPTPSAAPGSRAAATAGSPPAPPPPPRPPSGPTPRTPTREPRPAGTRYAQPDDYVHDQSGDLLARQQRPDRPLLDDQGRPLPGRPDRSPRNRWSRRRIRVVQRPNHDLHRQGRRVISYGGEPNGFACALDLRSGRTAAVATAPTNDLATDAGRAGVALAPRNGGHLLAARRALGDDSLQVIEDVHRTRGLVGFTAIDAGARGVHIRLESSTVHNIYGPGDWRVPPAVVIEEIQRAAQAMFPNRRVFFRFEEPPRLAP